MSHEENGAPTAEARLTDSFHRLGRVLPDDQQLKVVPPDMLAQDALDIMNSQGFSQLPVCLNGHVLGLFSYRSFAMAAVKLGDTPVNQKQLPGELEVVECLEDPLFAPLDDEFKQLLDAAGRTDVILVGDREHIQGVLTVIDILRYLNGITSPFVLIAEIELALRGLIRRSVNDERLRECCDLALSHYASKERPYTVETMTFRDYVAIVGDGRNWIHFHPLFRGDRVRTRTKLSEVGQLRNDIFHFRREISEYEHKRLFDLRNWIALLARTAEASKKGSVE